MNQMRPGAIAVLAGGVILIISSFLDWTGPLSAWENAFFGLTGLFVFVIGALCAAVAAIRAFAPQVNLPSRVASLTLDQAVLALGVAVLLFSFGLLFRDESAKIGTILAVVSSLAIVVGAHLEGATGGRAADRAA